MKESIYKYFHIVLGWLKKLSSPVVVGGLYVSDSSIRFEMVKRSKKIKASLRLPPGIIENGNVGQKDDFINAINEIYRRAFGNSRKSAYVVLTLPINDIYVQGFSIPKTEGDQIYETAELNMQVVSPIDIEHSYNDWQEVEEDDKQSGQRELLGAFAPKSVIDPFIDAIAETNFVIASIEFTSISLIREVKSRKIIEGNVPYMIVSMSAEGLSFIISRNGAPFFHYFHSWKEIQGDKKTVQIQDFEIFFRNEMNRILNFYATHWSGKGIKNVVVITPAFSDEIKNIAETDFKGIGIKVFSPGEISAVSGAARRGVLYHSEKRDVSLAGVNVFDIFSQERMLSFIKVWRNIFVSSFGVLLATFVIANIYFTNVTTEVANDNNFVLNAKDSKELDTLQSKAVEFNELVNKISEIKSNGYDVAGVMNELNLLTGSDVALKRVLLNTESGAANVSALASNEETARIFIKKIDDSDKFVNVDLTLSNLSREEGRILFNFSFEVEGK